MPALPYGPFNGRILKRIRVTEADTAGEWFLFWCRSLGCYVVSDSVTNENVGDAWGTVLCTIEASADGETGRMACGCLLACCSCSRVHVHAE